MKNKHRFILNNENSPQQFKIEYDIEAIINQLKVLKIKNGEIVLCRTECCYGVYCLYIANLRYGSIPVFFNYPVSENKSSLLEQKLYQVLPVKAKILFNEKHQISVEPVRPIAENDVKIPEGSVIFLTSATSGDPKFVIRTGEQLNQEVKRYIQYLKINDLDVIVPAIPVDNSFGIGSCIMTALKAEAVIAEPGSTIPRYLIQYTSKVKATIMLGPLFIYRQIKEVGRFYQFDEKLRFCITAGSPMLQGLQDDFFQNFGVPLLQQYGSTETGCLAVSEPGDPYRVVGKPLAGVTFKIIPDEDEKPVIGISSPDTIGSYITETGLIPLDKQDYLSNDVGNITSTGKLEIFGRKDDLVNIMGLKIPLNFVGATIRQFPGIAEVNLTVNETLNNKEIYCQYTAIGNIDEAALVDFCMTNLPNYQIPKRFERIEQLKVAPIKSWKNE
jgi:acyl-coenzyme A synthetase/AMP-(fatty) acid ligase